MVERTLASDSHRFEHWKLLLEVRDALLRWLEEEHLSAAAAAQPDVMGLHEAVLAHVLPRIRAATSAQIECHIRFCDRR